MGLLQQRSDPRQAVSLAYLCPLAPRSGSGGDAPRLIEHCVCRLKLNLIALPECPCCVMHSCWLAVALHWNAPSDWTGWRGDAQPGTVPRHVSP